jgi:pyridoxal phosphate enzyme (YggS family)
MEIFLDKPKTRSVYLGYHGAMTPRNVAHRLQQVRRRIAIAEQKAGRPAGSVTLVAVSKTKPKDVIEEAFEAGQLAFGENYAQEAIDKATAITGAEVKWHFIGPVQSNKTRALAAGMDWIHTVDRPKIALRLNEQRPNNMSPLNVCVQVNISREPSKAGLLPEDLDDFLSLFGDLPNLKLRGLMAIPAPASTAIAQRRPFRQLRQLFERSQAKYPTLDTLSMGMSADLEAAVAEGATMVRIGTDIFGPR